jgi:hypothetical protein
VKSEETAVEVGRYHIPQDAKAVYAFPPLMRNRLIKHKAKHKAPPHGREYLGKWGKHESLLPMAMSGAGDSIGRGRFEDGESGKSEILFKHNDLYFRDAL